MNAFFSTAPINLHKALAAIRIIVGLLLVYHGQEVFNPELMNGYAEWETFKDMPANMMVYAGKGAELIAGVLLTLGLYTRLSALITIGTFAYITFFVGHGHFWYEDQHPFMFVLFGLLFFFTGPGVWSLDGILFGKGNTSI
jgi:putative oxidoreductase